MHHLAAVLIHRYESNIRHILPEDPQTSWHHGSSFVLSELTEAMCADLEPWRNPRQL
jgi:hypothetical protein